MDNHLLVLDLRAKFHLNVFVFFFFPSLLPLFFLKLLLNANKINLLKKRIISETIMALETAKLSGNGRSINGMYSTG